MQALPAKDYATIPGDTINMSPEDGCIGMDKAGMLTGFRVGVRSAVIPFFQSLSPCYQQSPAINDKSVSYDAGSAAQTGQSALKDICQGAGFAAQLAGAWVPEVKLLTDVVAKLSTYGRFGSKVIEYLQDKNVITGQLPAPKSTGEKHRPCAQNNVPQGALIVSTIVALAQMPIAAAAPDPSKVTIPVPDQETLEQIGKNDKYPLDGHYIQTQDINSDVSIGSEEGPFAGRYDGGCHTISGQQRCLFGKLDGVVSDLRMAQAHVENNEKTSAVVACKMGEGSRLENLLIEHSSVVINAATDEDLDLGSERSKAGVVTGHQQQNSCIEQVKVNNCSVTSNVGTVSVGIISGQNEGDIRHSTVNNGRVKTLQPEVYTGIGAGEVKGRIGHFTVLNSKVESETEEMGDIFSGIGGGKILSGGRLEKLTAVNSSVKIEKTRWAGDGELAAGIGTGENVGLLKGVTAISCNLTTEGDKTSAGIGAGINGAGNKGDIFDIRAIRCLVSTSGHSHGENTRAGIGAGNFNQGRIEGITVLDSSITARGEGSRAGIGTGEYDFHNFPFPFNNSAIINMTDSIKAVNVIVNGELKNIGNVSQATLDQLCGIADQRFIANDCRITGQFSKDDWSCPSTVSPTRPSSAGVGEINSAPSSLVNLSASATALLNNTGAPVVSLVTGAESGAALSTGAIAGITVGVVGALGLGALFAWRYYVHRSDPDVMTMRVLNSHRKHSRFQMRDMSDFE